MVAYAGVSKRVGSRLQTHATQALAGTHDNPLFTNWIGDRVRENRLPMVLTVDGLTGTAAYSLERLAIHWCWVNCNLTTFAEDGTPVHMRMWNKDIAEGGDWPELVASKKGAAVTNADKDELGRSRNAVKGAAATLELPAECRSESARKAQANKHADARKSTSTENAKANDGTLRKLGEVLGKSCPSCRRRSRLETPTG